MENSDMMSETTFATSFTSFWQSVTPNFERLVRRLNLNLERFGLPIDGRSLPNRRAYLNEVGFQLFRYVYPRGDLDSLMSGSIKKEVCEKSRSYLSRFDRIDKDLLSDPTNGEWQEVTELFRAIADLVTQEGRGKLPVIISPRFPGCGILDTCFGDLIVGDQLIEIKAGDRSFRATDIRQLLIYCALNSSERVYAIKRVGCANPRRGTHFSINIETLSLELSSQPAVELLSEIIYFVSSGDMSV